MKEQLKVVAATAIYCGVHSVLASRRVKSAAARLMGWRVRNAWYRALFNAQAVIGLGALYWYARRIPSPVMYEVKGAARVGMRVVQAAGVAYLAWAANEVGWTELLGVRPVLSGMEGKSEPEPEAQGPNVDVRELKTTGPFRASRHPLNFAPIPTLWAEPRMTRNLLLFNAVSTVYFVVGSMHEESRLVDAYGEKYEDYRNSGVPFFVPDVRRLLHAEAKRDIRETVLHRQSLDKIA